MKVKALTPFVHNRYDLNEGQEIEMPEATANDLKDAGLVEIVGDGEKTQRPAARQARAVASATPSTASRAVAASNPRAQAAAGKAAQLPENKMAPPAEDKGEAGSSPTTSSDAGTDSASASETMSGDSGKPGDDAANA